MSTVEPLNIKTLEIISGKVNRAISLSRAFLVLMHRSQLRSLFSFLLVEIDVDPLCLSSSLFDAFWAGNRAHLSSASRDHVYPSDKTDHRLFDFSESGSIVKLEPSTSLLFKWELLVWICFFWPYICSLYFHSTNLGRYYFFMNLTWNIK